MIKVALLCDDCGAVIADGKDLCLACAADAPAASPPTVPDYELNAEGRPRRPA
jgi:hypothetical protein